MGCARFHAWPQTTIDDGLGPGMKRSTTHNPQANSVVERVHQMLNDMLRTEEWKKENWTKTTHLGKC